MMNSKPITRVYRAVLSSSDLKIPQRLSVTQDPPPYNTPESNFFSTQDVLEGKVFSGGTGIQRVFAHNLDKISCSLFTSTRLFCIGEKIRRLLSFAFLQEIPRLAIVGPFFTSLPRGARAEFNINHVPFYTQWCSTDFGDRLSFWGRFR